MEAQTAKEPSPVVASNHPRRKLNPRGKKAKVLRVFLERGDQGLNCFEAVELARDFVLRSSVSEFQRDLGIRFHKEWRKFKNAGGSTTEFIQYRLTAEGAAIVRQLLAEAEAL